MAICEQSAWEMLAGSRQGGEVSLQVQLRQRPTQMVRGGGSWPSTSGPLATMRDGAQDAGDQAGEDQDAGDEDNIQNRSDVSLAVAKSVALGVAVALRLRSFATVEHELAAEQGRVIFSVAHGAARLDSSYVDDTIAFFQITKRKTGQASPVIWDPSAIKIDTILAVPVPPCPEPASPLAHQPMRPVAGPPALVGAEGAVRKVAHRGPKPAVAEPVASRARPCGCSTSKSELHSCMRRVAGTSRKRLLSAWASRWRPRHCACNGTLLPHISPLTSAASFTAMTTSHRSALNDDDKQLAPALALAEACCVTGDGTRGGDGALSAALSVKRHCLAGSRAIQQKAEGQEQNTTLAFTVFLDLLCCGGAPLRGTMIGGACRPRSSTRRGYGMRKDRVGEPGNWAARPGESLCVAFLALVGARRPQKPSQASSQPSLHLRFEKSRVVDARPVRSQPRLPFPDRGPDLQARQWQPRPLASQPSESPAALGSRPVHSAPPLARLLHLALTKARQRYVFSYLAYFVRPTPWCRCQRP